MSLYDYYATIVTGVAQDAALTSWAVANFGGGISVFSGMPHDSIPDMTDDVPFVLFGEPAMIMYGKASNRIVEFGWGAWLGLSNDSEQYAIAQNETRPAGIKLAWDGIKLVREAIESSQPSDKMVSYEFSAFVDVEPVGSQILANMDIVFTQTLTIGVDPVG